MDADDVRKYTNAKWPQAMRSPLAQLFGGAIARDEADRAVEFARMQAKVTSARDTQMRRDAMEHAVRCINACDAAGIEYDEETLGHNIEGNFPELDPDECDDIARAALSKLAG